MPVFIKQFLFSSEIKHSLSGGDEDSGTSCTIGSEIYLDVSYLHYLYDARLSISSCLRACQVWSAPYDGEDPPPDKYQAGVLTEPGLKSWHTQMVSKRVPPPLAPHPRPCPPPSVNQLELEWDDSYDVCPVQSAEAAVETKPPQSPAAEPPKHIQEMRRTAIMLVKGSYVEENDFQDDVMVYDLVSQKDSKDVEHRELKSNRSASQEAQPSSAEVPLKNGLSLTPPIALMADDSKNSLDLKVKDQRDCSSSLQKSTAAELGEDLLAQYDELIRTFDPGAGGKQVRTGAELKKPVTPAAEEEEEEMDFTSFTAETPEPEKLHSPFGKFFSAGVGRNQSVPFTGKSSEAFPLQQPH